MAELGITGRSLSSDEFRAVETKSEFTPDYLLKLLDGELAALVINEALPDSTCGELVNRFWNSPGRRPRTDGVSGYYLGAYQYGKSFDDYVAEVADTAKDVDALFEGLQSPVDLVMNAVREAVTPRDVTVRIASWRGQPVARARAMSWTAEGRFLLAPHEDLGQLTHPAQTDFEIQKVPDYEVLAVNTYPRAPKPGGDLRIWNIRPDSACRKRFGTEHTGYPYPESTLKGIPYFDITIGSGMTVITNGGLVHAVIGYGDQTELAGERLLINFSFGYVDSHTVVHWV